MESLKGRSFSKNAHKLPKHPERRRSLVLHAVYRTVEWQKCAKAKMLVLKTLLRCRTKKPLIIRQTQSIDLSTRKDCNKEENDLSSAQTKQRQKP